MQLYVGDYKADTSTLTIEQHGAYLLLLMAMWTAGGALPNDEKKLARSIGATRKQWLRIWSEIRPFFTVVGDDLTQKRVTLERQKWNEKSSARRASGARGGAAKALKTSKGDVANATPNATILPQQNATILHIPSPKEDDDKRSSSWGREEFDQAEKLLREAAGLQCDPDPTLADISPFMALVNAGISFDGVIVPKVKTIASRWKRRPGKPWAYLADAVANSLAEERDRAERVSEKLNTGARKEQLDEYLRILAE